MVFGGGVTLKPMQSPDSIKCFLRCANTYTMEAMMARPEFSIEQCIRYTEMIGKLACRSS